MIKITTERPEHADAVETLLDAAFGADRHLKISYSYRNDVDKLVGLCLVALEDDALAATIRYWPVTIGDTPSLLLGPIAVAENHRNAGLGGKLIRCSLGRAATIGYRSVILVGDEAYYGRFGFSPAGRHDIIMPRENPDRVLALSLLSNRDALPSGPIGSWRSVRRSAFAA
jgi:predicted N-acetyltransferase YhbS